MFYINWNKFLSKNNLKISVYISVFIKKGDNSFTKILFKLKHIKIFKK